MDAGTDTDTDSDTDPISVRLADPGEFAASLPHLLGFRPRESIVLVSLAGPTGGRVGLTVRADIPDIADAPLVARMLADRVCTDHPSAVLVVVVSEAPDEQAASGGQVLPHLRLVGELSKAMAARALAVPDVLLVRNGTWWSYDCPRVCCAPGGGTPLPTGVTELEAASVATGMVVADARDDLAGRIARPPGFDPGAMAAACARAASACSGDIVARGWQATAEASWAAVTAAVARCRPGASGPRLSDAEIARLLWGLRDADVRDRALALALGPDAGAAEVLWTDCTRRALAPLDAAPATLLAVSAWLRGDGAMANIALSRALAAEPGYRLALLLAGALDACLAPRELRTLIRKSLDDSAVLGDPVVLGDRGDADPVG